MKPQPTKISGKTLTQLPPETYTTPNVKEQLRALYAGLRYNLVIDSILEGNTPAWVFVDNGEVPQTALLWNRQDALLLAGAADNATVNAAVGDVIAQQVIPNAKQRYIPELALFYDHEGWQAARDVILQDVHPVLADRRYYQMGTLKVDWQAQIPTDCEIQPINTALLAKQDIQHMPHVIGWVDSFWRSHETFTEKSLGYALLTRDAEQRLTVASWSLAVYVSGTNFELGLATHPDFRRRGFATLVAAASVDHCLTRGYTAHWHCWNENAASIATAEKVGFVNPTGYRVYRFELGVRS